MKTLKFLGVHGLGDHRASQWRKDWEDTVRRSFPSSDDVQLEFKFVTYDPIFARISLSTWDCAKAIAKLGRSGLSSLRPGRRGVLGDLPDKVRWTAGYVVAWVESEEFKGQTRKLILDAVATEKPDFVLAHSLGSLVTYDAFSHPDASEEKVAAALAKCRYVTLGSQIGNAFVVGNLSGGRVQPLPVEYWYHLYNEEDAVFTAPIRLWGASNFRQIDTPFDIPGIADHSAEEYLGNRATIENVWAPAAEEQSAPAVRGGRRRGGVAASPAALRKAGRRSRRALLVGINEYPDKADRLEGCVNDVFLMSSVLQECGFDPESIRVCLDGRATAQGIRDRLEWLLDDPKPGDERVFFYSGHGARIPEYGEDMEPDRQCEALVPHDFDWSPERAILDDEIYSLYTQLPYDTRFAMILDCCHSGGMHRQGAARVRGLTPPDDIRHRELKWDSKTDMWVQRDFRRINKQFSTSQAANEAFFGSRGVTTRLGRASLVRQQTLTEYERSKERVRGSRVGPYLPLIIEACSEDQFSYEYRHGAVSYGAFTYAFCKELRRQRQVTFRHLLNTTSDVLSELGYQQTPQILGPAEIVDARVPWED